MSDKETYGCVMLFFNPHDILRVEIDEEDLYYSNDPKQYWISGLEVSPHVTVLYGLHNDINHKLVVSFISNMQVPLIKFKSIDVFKQDDYDVVVFKVEGKTLHDNNAALRDEFPYTTDFPEYKPHCTIAYVKSGLGEKYKYKFNEFEAKPIKWVYSLDNGEEFNIPISSKDIVEQIMRMKKMI